MSDSIVNDINAFHAIGVNFSACRAEMKRKNDEKICRSLAILAELYDACQKAEEAADDSEQLLKEISKNIEKSEAALAELSHSDDKEESQDNSNQQKKDDLNRCIEGLNKSHSEASSLHDENTEATSTLKATLAAAQSDHDNLTSVIADADSGMDENERTIQSSALAHWNYLQKQQNTR